MDDANQELPDSVEALREMVLAQRATIAERNRVIESRESMIESRESTIESRDSTIESLDSEVSTLREYVRLLKAQRFAAKNEKVHPDQLLIFNEAEQHTQGETSEPETVTVPAHARRRGRRKPLPDSIPVEEIVHDLADEEKVCAAGHAMSVIGQETSEQLDIVPAKLRRLRHVRPKYACSRCKVGIKIAELPPQPIPKSLASPGLLAHIAISKYVDGMPLFRQEAAFSRIGILLPRSTMATWMVKAGQLARPVVGALHRELLERGFVQMDETRFQVLKEPGKEATSLSYLWALRSGGRDRPGILYHYAPSREGAVAKELLGDFCGLLQTDGYQGYDAVGAREGITHIGCFAHARRKFHDAWKAQGGSARTQAKNKKHKNAKRSQAERGLAWFRELYRVERETAELSPEARHLARQEQTAPILQDLKAWLDETRPVVPPASLTGKALTYLANQWPKLARVLGDGRVPLDTNDIENHIRPFAVGRKAWLFADTMHGAEASANLYSLVETAKANGLDPHAYLRFVFERVPHRNVCDDFSDLLPFELSAEDLATT